MRLGLRSPGLQAKLDQVERRKAGLEASLSQAPAPAPRLHPNLAEVYRRRVAELGQALADPALRDEALTLLRGLVEQVTITPEGKATRVEFVGQIASMLILPSPAEAGRMTQHESAAKGVAGARYPLYRKILRLYRRQLVSG